MARVLGRLEHEDPFHPLLGDVLRPLVDVSVRIGDNSVQLDLQIDTGADYTVLSPAAARRTLRGAYDLIDFEQDDARFDLYGISGSPSEYVIRDATLTFHDEQMVPLTIDIPILIARPSTPQPTPDSNWEAPSLLGQDALRSFDLALSYNPPSVSLTEAAHA
ncbi:MAG: hypothetical protein OXS30_09565 [Chloroflexota bacterium]|nr:hypothetical protein [Chloroflexota bacterium]